MITRVVENKLRPASDVKTRLCNVSVKEGRMIGGGLALALASHETAEAGVDEWILKYRCLIELDRTEAWFRPMMNTVANRRLEEVSWGIMMRVMVGAGLSVMDLATDIFVIWEYMGGEETKVYGWILLWMVVATTVLQLVVVFMQNRKKPWILAKEFLIVLTLLKPAVDAFRVGSDQKMEEHHVIDAKSMLVATKMNEMLCESIPGCLLQLYILLKNKELLSTSTVGSVIVSAMTTGFSSAIISFE